MTDSLPSNTLLQYLKSCADLGEAPGKDQDGLAYVSPSKVREAVAEIERLTRERDETEGLYQGVLQDNRDIAGMVEPLQAERDRLRAENERLTGELEAERGNAETILQGREKIAAERDRLHAALEMHDQIECDTDAWNRRLVVALRGMLHLYEHYDQSADGTAIVAAAREALNGEHGADRPAHETTARMHAGASALTDIADKLDTAEDLTDCERGCAADAIREYAAVIKVERSPLKASGEPT